MLPPPKLREYSILGELSLDGRVKAVRGALPIAAAASEQAACAASCCRRRTRAEAAVVHGIDIIPVEHARRSLRVPARRAQHRAGHAST